MDNTPKSYSTNSVEKPSNLLSRFLQDFRASIVVFLVALPLCVAIGLASVPKDSAQYANAAAIGILTGIIGGLIVGLFSGSPLQVSGPAAGLIVVVYGLIAEYGFHVMTMALMVGGILQLTAGLLRWGQLFRAVSPAVIQGMLAGIGVLIFADQFHVMLDHASPGKGLKAIIGIPEALGGMLSGDEPRHRWSAIIGVTTIVTILAWQFLGPKKLKFLPAPLVAVLVATCFAALMTFDFGVTFKPVTMPNSLLEAVTIPKWDMFFSQSEGMKWNLLMIVLQSGVTIAAIASAETLLCAGAVDRMQTEVRTKYDRELSAQGIGNFLSGLVGGLPMTGVIVRSSANVDAGAKSRWSAVMHGVWLLLLLLFIYNIKPIFQLVPLSCLAAILVLTGYKLMNFKGIVRLWKVGKGEVLIFAATVIMIVATDLLTGVLIGIGLSGAKLLYKFSRLQIKVEETSEKNVTTMTLLGTATFIKLPKLAKALEEVKPTTELHIELRGLSYIDHACLELIMNWEKQHHANGGSLVMDWDTLTSRFNETEDAKPNTNITDSPENGKERDGLFSKAGSSAGND